MNKYPKIPTLFKRDPTTKFRTLLDGEFATPELDYLQNNDWVMTEKVDGTNIRIIWQSGKIVFGGKTDNAQIPSQLIHKLMEIFLPLQDTFTSMFEEDICLYGEGYGNKIQKGGSNYHSLTQEFVLFDIKIGDYWLLRLDVMHIAEKLGLHCVPIVATGPLALMVKTVRNGIQSTWGDFLAEGLVARPDIPLCDRHGNRIITKLKTKDFCSK